MIRKNISVAALTLLLVGSSVLGSFNAGTALAASNDTDRSERATEREWNRFNLWGWLGMGNAHLYTITPTEGDVDTEVTVSGKKFTNKSIVRVGKEVIQDPIITDGGKKVTFTIPSTLSPATYKVWVQNGHQISNALYFKVTDVGATTSSSGPLSIIDISGPVDLEIDEEGSWDVDVESMGEGNLQYSVKWGDEGNSLMRFFGLNAGVVQSSSSFTHTYQTAGTYQPEFTVTDSEGNTVTKLAQKVAVGAETAIPHITSIEDATRMSGEMVILYGTGFDQNSTVKVGNATTTGVMVVNSTKITFIAPTMASGTYPVTVTDNDGTSNSVNLTLGSATSSGKLSISGINAPTRLTVDQSGTWTVDAETNLTGNLQYSVDWGGGTMAKSATASNTTQTSATFTHAYESVGTYKPTFTVRDAQGHTATVSASVKVTAASL